MNIALVAATKMEIQPTLRYLSERMYLRKHQRIDIIITGVGMMNTAYCLTKKFVQDAPTLAIQAGIAGSYHSIYAPGMAVTLKEDMIGDLGVMEGGDWNDVFDMGLAGASLHPWSDKKLINPNKELLKKVPLECVRGVTVNEISSDPAMICKLKNKYLPVVESMEGAAFHFVCIMEKIRFIQIRGISNYVGERDKSKWKIEAAVNELNNQLINLINQITDPY
jgi:futalosine hydrolase